MATPAEPNLEIHDSARSPVSAPDRLLVVENLGKCYPGKSGLAIQGVDFTIGPGEVLGLVGLNGAGKTTTIRIAAGLIRPSEGHVLVAGHDIVREKELASRHLGLVPENPMFDPMAKPLSLLRYFAGYYGPRDDSARSKCLELLESVGLKDAVSKRFGAFSLGMKKRFGVAAALIGDPEVLLLDETLSGLDPQGVAFVRDKIQSWREDGKAVLLSSHQLNEVQSLSDRVAVIHRGKCVRVYSGDETSGEGSRTLRIMIVDIGDRAVDYLSRFGDVMREGQTIWVRQFHGEPGEVSFELARRGFHVSELTLHAPSLEDRFFELIEQKNGVPSEFPAGHEDDVA